MAAHLAAAGWTSPATTSPPAWSRSPARPTRLRFEVATLRALPVADAALGGLLAWYSLIHTPPAELPTAVDEFARVSAPALCC